MATRRVARLAQAILETVSTTVLFQLRDPRIKNVTILRVDVAGDLRTAKVYVSVRGDEKQSALTLKGLNAARGFLQSKIADRIETRYTPVLTFLLDEDRGDVVSEAQRILEELENERRGTEESYGIDGSDSGNILVTAEVDAGDEDEDEGNSDY